MTRPKPTLRQLSADLLAAAAAAPGRLQRRELRKGARIAAQVDLEGRTLFVCARTPQPLGDTEISTFRAHAGIPAGAERIPATGQRRQQADGQLWHLVGWRWTPTQADQLFLDEPTDEETR